MDCRLIQEQLLPFHFGTLAAAERAELEAHLPTCSACVTAWLSLKHALEAEGGLGPSLDVRERLRSAVAEELRAARPRRRLRQLRWFAAGAALAAALAALWFFRPAPQPPPAQDDPVDSAAPTRPIQSIL